MAILICDAPTHGKLYNGGVGDNHPNEDIRDAIELLIHNEILLIGINFTKHTETMFKEILKVLKYLLDRYMNNIKSKNCFYSLI
jgi:hypothetical protein